MNTDKITDKIKHLLSIAHDPSASEAEREQAMNRAHAWMLKHGIEVAHEDHTGGGGYGHREMDLPGVYAETQAQMLYFIALSYKSFDMVLTKVPHSSSVRVTIAGPEAQLDDLYRMFESILEQSTAERKDWASKTLRGINRSVQKRHIKSFYLGYGSKVADRIEAILEAEASQRDKQALVLVKDKATNYLEDMHGKLESKKRKQSVASSAFVVGSLAGERAQLNNQLA